MAETEPSEEEQKIENPECLAIKHPLHRTWTLWYYHCDRKRNWEDNLKQVTSFESVEDFWSIYHHIKPPSELTQGCDYNIFVKGVRPMWEDAANKNGGRWLLTLEKNMGKDAMDDYWLETLLCMIGEAFGEFSEEICGAVVNHRGKGNKISLWTGDADKSKTNSILAIGRKLKERLNLPPGLALSYQIHKETQSKSGSSSRSAHTL